MAEFKNAESADECLKVLNENKDNQATTNMEQIIEKQLDQNISEKQVFHVRSINSIPSDIENNKTDLVNEGAAAAITKNLSKGKFIRIKVKR